MEISISALAPTLRGGRLRGALPTYAIFALGCFFVLRLGIMAWAWGDIPHSLQDLGFILGVGFIHDLAFMSYAALPFALVAGLLPQKILETGPARWATFLLVFICSAILWFILIAEVVFWDEFGTRFNFIAVDYLVYTTEVMDNIRESYPLGWILGGISLLALVTTWAFRGFVQKGDTELGVGVRRGMAGFCLAAAFASYGLVTPALKDGAVNNFAAELSCNGPYQFVQAFKHSSLDYGSFYAQGSEAELSRILSERVVGGAGNTSFNIRRPVPAAPTVTTPNLILISVESLSAEFLGRFGASRGPITPFMDAWFKEGLVFTNCYAAGTRTTRGLDALTLSMPPLPGCAIVKRPDNDRLFSLGKVLQDKGYDTAYIYGGRAYFDNMRTFFSGNGYRVVDQTSVPSERIVFANAWGMCDEDLYEETLHEASATYEAGQPFFFHVMTTSNHRPFTFPEGKIDIPSGDGRAGAVKYTDYALKRFMELARILPWFENTVFVVVADHCASSAGKVGLPMEKYHIPLFIYAPGIVSPREVGKVCSQIDVAPTVLRLMGVSYESRFFGQDILDPSYCERTFVSTYQKLGYYRDGRLAILSPVRRIEVVTNPLQGEGLITEGSPDDPLVREAQAFYQGADQIHSRRLNRW